MTDWIDLDLTEEHAEYLAAHAIDPEILEDSGVVSALVPEDLPEGVPEYWPQYLPGLLYPWRFGGEEAWQIAPDDRDRYKKYMFVEDSQTFMNEVIENDDDGPVLIVEGSKQQYAAASYVAGPWSVYGIAGCWNWTTADLSVFEGREVVVIFDGDVATNRDVYDGGVRLKENLDLYGAASVKFAILPSSGSDGLDDWLALAPAAKRTGLLERLIGSAKDLPTKAPKLKIKSNSPYFDPKEGLLAVATARAVMEANPCAITKEGRIAIYRHGVYVLNDAGIKAAAVELLGDKYRPSHRAAIEETMMGLLEAEGQHLPEEQLAPILNCRNGMLDLLTLELHDHDPKWFSVQQIPVDWDPDAVCPEYERWIKGVLPDQVDDFEETAAQMLDPSRTPTKALFAYGPSRSGKSTALRLLGAIAGATNTSAVTLHQLGGDRFAAANLYGKMLNSAADLSSAYVEDLSIFKMLTGDDPIQANRKYGGQFMFKNHALFAFSANELPTVGESSRAYSERIRPLHFGQSFAGAEDHSIEAAMQTELSGILRRLVEAGHRKMERGTWLAPNEAVQEDFERKSDRIRMWVWDHCDIIPADPGQVCLPEDALGRSTLSQVFNRWAKENHMAPIQAKKINERVANIPAIVEARTATNRSRRWNLVLRDEPRSESG